MRLRLLRGIDQLVLHHIDLLLQVLGELGVYLLQRMALVHVALGRRHRSVWLLVIDGLDGLVQVGESLDCLELAFEDVFPAFFPRLEVFDELLKVSQASRMA